MQRALAILLLVFTALSLRTAKAQELEHFDWYDNGWVPYLAAQIDARFLYVPEDYDQKGSKTYPLLVRVHGTERGPRNYPRHNVEFAEENDVILLAPCFRATRTATWISRITG
jgi:hypothetical protein